MTTTTTAKATDKSKAKTAKSRSAAKEKSAAIAAKTIQYIKKATEQSPLGVLTGTWPHQPSGSSTIDLLIGGQTLPDGSGLLCPGYPEKRIIEIYGAESSGKTTAALAAVASVQKAGGVAMFLDFENALHHGYARTIGVSFDPTELLYYAPDHLEQGMQMLYVAIKTGVNLIVIDSVAAMVPQAELEKDIKDPARVGALASAMSRNLAKMVQWLKDSTTVVILINQTRSLISKMSYGGDDDNTAGGKAVKFYATCRLKLTRLRSDFVEKKDPITLRKKKQPFGNLVQVKVVKNKMQGNQGHTGEIFIRFGYGIDNYHSMIEAAIPRNIIKKEGAFYTYGGERHKGKDRLRKFMIDNPSVATEIEQKLAKALLAEAPEPLTGEDEIEDEAIFSDMRKELGDDDLVESESEEEKVFEAVVEDIGAEAS